MPSIEKILIFLSQCYLFIVIISAKASYDRFHPSCPKPYCYSLDMNKVHDQLGTKSIYPRYTDSTVNKPFIVPNCTPKKMWVIIRHGSRFPTSKELEKMQKLNPLKEVIMANYEKPSIKQNLCRMCDADYQLLKNWQWHPNLTTDNSNKLAEKGWIDMRVVSSSLQKMFPQLFDKKYSKRTYKFLYAKERRTRDSYRAFVEGLFGHKAYEHIKPPRLDDDELLLKPYEKCKESIKNADKVDEEQAEPWKFEQSDDYQKMVRDVSLRLGFREPLNMTRFKQIWNMCTYEQSWNFETSSPWCAAFLKEHYDLLDYKEDLVYYYKKSYGAMVNLKLTCGAVIDMLRHMENDDIYKVVAYFVHSTFSQLFLTALGALKDKHMLRADNFNEMKNRLFRSSITTPLASNLAIVRYDCPLEKERDKVMFLLNQMPMEVEWCQKGLCNFSDMKKAYAKYANLDCDNTFCDPYFNGFPEDIEDFERKHNASTGDFCQIPSLILISVCLLIIKLGRNRYRFNYY